MTSPASSEGKLPKGTARMSKSEKEGQPEWANGLRQLYDSVVDEPLPDTFKDLLSKLDSKD
ncbi:NepR family anti-sigma factor [Qipengyuania seohaensis]|uniref:NepR family anti-sigma factor n=1 Tax=Qipengyuania seohaensis TaxID=266951 RepID=UPI000C21E66F|nr:NepR family anti-sigma factor [Qipengyuania seohaensis]